MTKEQAKRIVQEWVDRGYITVKQADEKLYHSDFPNNISDAWAHQEEVRRSTQLRLSKIEKKYVKLMAKEPNVIKIGDLVKLDPLFLSSEAIGLVTEIRKTKNVNFLYVDWVGERPNHYDISDRLGTKEYYFIKLDKKT